MSDLAATDEDRQVLEFMSSGSQIGRALFAPPGVPEDRITALRTAFDMMIKDPEFITAASGGPGAPFWRLRRAAFRHGIAGSEVPCATARRWRRRDRHLTSKTRSFRCPLINLALVGWLSSPALPLRSAG
jgi:hypothetical protein